MLIMTLHFFAVSYSQQKKLKNKEEINLLISSHKKENDSLNKLNFLDIKYQYLDKNFKIRISHLDFSSINVDNRITTNYKDSLMVVLKHELKNDNAAGKAFHRILYKWEKVGFYIWKTEEQAKALGNSLGFNHPYRFYEYLMDKSISTQKKLNILKEVKLKLEEKHKNKSYNIKPYKTFLNEAFKLNPDRIKAMEDYIKENSKHKH